MLMKKTILLPTLGIFLSLIFYSCGSSEPYSPYGIWQEKSGSQKKYIVQKEGKTKLAMRAKDSYYWAIFRDVGQERYFGEEGDDLYMLSNDSMQIYNKKFPKFKRTFIKTNSKIEGFWLLNIRMKPDMVREIVGEPDSTSTAKSLEEWFYFPNRIIRFDKYGVKTYSENNIIKPDYYTVNDGDHYDTVIEKLGEPDWERENFSRNGKRVDDLFYKEIAKITLEDSLVVGVISDLHRNTEEWITLIDDNAEMISFTSLPDSLKNGTVKVNEKARDMDVLKPKFRMDDERGFLTFKGRKYHLIIKFQGDNMYKAIYSRYEKKRRRSEELTLETAPIELMNFSIDPDMLNEGRLAGKLHYIIPEKAQKNTIIHGSFNVPIPEVGID